MRWFALVIGQVRIYFVCVIVLMFVKERPVVEKGLGAWEGSAPPPTRPSKRPDLVNHYPT